MFAVCSSPSRHGHCKNKKGHTPKTKTDAPVSRAKHENKKTELTNDMTRSALPSSDSAKKKNDQEKQYSENASLSPGVLAHEPRVVHGIRKLALHHRLPHHYPPSSLHVPMYFLETRGGGTGEGRTDRRSMGSKSRRNGGSLWTKLIPR